jgi:hypothetical protein
MLIEDDDFPIVRLRHDRTGPGGLAEGFVARSGAETYAKFLGCPMLVTASDADARAVAERLLTGEPAATIDVPEPHDRGEE